MVAVFREPRADPRGSDHDVVAMMQVQCRHRGPILRATASRVAPLWVRHN
jgi:hypothetical protein